ncbi:MAG: PQQ-binding-like beta-propeller repeat protein [Blastocatellia bacterium]
MMKLPSIPPSQARACCCTFALLFLLATQARAQTANWLQWGGPQRNFMVEAKGLAETWPANGPKRLWSRALGEGHSSIIVDADRLYTMYRKGEQEFVIALDRATGRTIWEKGYAAPATGVILQENGRGPNATPLVAGDLLITVGATGKLHAWAKQTGNVVWAHDLWREYGGTRMERGYSCSPLAYQNTVIVAVGGVGQSLMAFAQKTGAVVWKKQNFRLSQSSPTLIQVDGQDQLVMAFADHVVGLDPHSGELFWQHLHPCGGLNITPPVWSADQTLFISSAYGCGSRALQLQQSGGKTTVKQLWAGNRMRVHHSTIIRLDDLVFGSSGDSGPTPMTAVNVKTGEAVWQDRSFPKATFVYADGKLILLDEDGQLALVRLSRQGMKVLAKAAVLEHPAWTPPTLVSTNLYLRDRRMIVALDLK